MSEDLSAKVLDVLRNASQPLSIDAVRYRTEIRSWDKARALLLELLYEKNVVGIKSSKSWIFWLEPREVREVASTS